MATTIPRRTDSNNMPPYLSVSKLSQLLNLVSTRKFVEIKPSELVHYGFGETDAYIGVTSLRFLGLIDDKNQAQESIKELHLQGTARSGALQNIVRNAYRAIFERVTDPMALADAELHNEFLVTYSIAPRIAKSAVRAFIFFCEEAGLRERSVPKEAPPPQQGGSPKKAQRSATPPKQSDVMDATGGLALTFKGGIRLVIPRAGPEVTTAVAQGELKGISDEINKFAEKYLEAKGTNT